MNSVLISGGRVIDPANNRDEIADVLIQDGKIVSVTPCGTRFNSVRPPTSDASGKLQHIDATGFIVCPGFIDTHVSLREPGFEEDECTATEQRRPWRVDSQPSRHSRTRIPSSMIGRLRSLFACRPRGLATAASIRWER